MAERKLTEYDRRRRSRRDALWPNASELMYDKSKEMGFCTLPRTVPLMAVLIRHLSQRKDPSRIYLDLWTRQRDDGFVEIEDAEEMAGSAGYPTAPRNVRTWREGMDELEKLGFIRTAARGTRKHKYVLLVHPHDVVTRLHRKDPAAIPDWWLSLFQNRLMDIGASLREPPELGPDAPEVDLTELVAPAKVAPTAPPKMTRKLVGDEGADEVLERLAKVFGRPAVPKKAKRPRRM